MLTGRTLPAWSLPLARRILGPGPLPVLATGPEVTRALGAVGAKAAATGSAIYLKRMPERSPESVEVLAHELSHVADRPVAPRFFLDRALDRAEERARAVGQAARTSAEQAESGVQNVAGLVSGSGVVEEASAPVSTLSSLPSEASEMAGSLAAEASGLAGEASGVVRGAEERVAAGVGQVKAAAAGFGTNDLDGLLEALEERIVSELERRGGRMAGVF